MKGVKPWWPFSTNFVIFCFVFCVSHTQSHLLSIFLKVILGQQMQLVFLWVNFSGKSHHTHRLCSLLSWVPFLFTTLREALSWDVLGFPSSSPVESSLVSHSSGQDFLFLGLCLHLVHHKGAQAPLLTMMQWLSHTERSLGSEWGYVSKWRVQRFRNFWESSL